MGMWYFTLDLKDTSQELCTSVLYFGEYTYQCLAMRLCCATCHCHRIMKEILKDADDADPLIGDIRSFSMSWKYCTTTPEQVLTKLKENRFIVNPKKWK